VQGLGIARDVHRVWSYSLMKAMRVLLATCHMAPNMPAQQQQQ
jgi:hypothetical protein